MNFEQLVSLLRDKGIAGAGGAGFPAYAKLNKKADILILNCAECEPLLRVHRQLLANYAYEILSTLDTVAKALGGIKEIIICLKGTYKEAIDAVNANLDQFKNVRMHFLGEFYPAGDEIVTIYEATGRKVKPGKIPITEGVIVFNTETVFNMYKAIEEDLPVTHKYLTIAGEVKKPVTFKAPIGITYCELLRRAGVNSSDVELIAGGPMTGRLANRLDVVTKTTNAILVLPKNSFVINKKHAKASIDMKRAMSSCCQCSMCTDLCPRNLLGHPIDPKEFMRTATTGVTKELKPFLDTMFCSGCGVCDMFACPQGLSPRKLIEDYKNGLRANGIAVPEREIGETNKARSYRKVSMSRLVQRLGLKKYDVPAPLTEEEIKPKEVKIFLNQSIGAPALATVKKGDVVKCGDIIAKFNENALSLNVHSSIDGTVYAVNEKFITIRG